MAVYIDTLNDLFYALFKPGEGDVCVIGGHQKLVREDYFRLFFPEELQSQYNERSKSNLTWFFNDDKKNKAIKRALIDLMKTDLQRVLSSMHQKCREVLWPQGQHAAFEREALKKALSGVRLRSALNVKYNIFETIPGKGCRMFELFDADPSAAMARVILTISVASDAAEELIAAIWQNARSADSYEFLSRATGADSRIRYARLLDLDGKYEQAFAEYTAAANKLGNACAQNAEESAMYCRLAVMLLTGEGHFRDEGAAVKYLQLGCHDDNPESWYLMARHENGDTAWNALRRSAELGYLPALREAGNACFSADSRLGCDHDLEKARDYFRAGINGESDDAAYCAYMLGRVYETMGDNEAAVDAYRIAQEKGSAEADESLARLGRLALTPRGGACEAEAEEHPLRYCVVNALTGSAREFVSSLRGSWRVAVCGRQQEITRRDGIEMKNFSGVTLTDALDSLCGELYAKSEPYPELVLCLLSDDWQDNLQQAIAAMNTLYDVAARCAPDKAALTESITIYVQAEHEYASLMLDAAMAQLRGLYFRVRICDPAADSADSLLSQAPLYLPIMREPEIAGVDIAVIGDSRVAEVFVRRAISMPLPKKYRTTLNVFGSGAASAQLRFEEKCPGVGSAAPTIRRVCPGFIPCDPANGELSALLRAAKNDEAPAGAAELITADYIVIATDDDALNIRLGVLLRTELLRLSPTFSNLPFIAIYVRDPVALRLADGITADPKGRGGWYSRYDLHCFGAAALYTYDALRSDIIEKRAQAIHLRYAGSPEGREARCAAMASYYRRQYNRDSSRATAAYLMTHLFAAGIALPDWHFCGTADAESVLGDAYAKWLEDPANVQEASQLEHERWNCFMLSEGWMCAAPAQVETYVRRGNPGHQLYLAKLHPFICDWVELQSGEIVRKVAEGVHSRMPEKEIHDPLEADTETVMGAAEILKVK